MVVTGLPGPGTGGLVANSVPGWLVYPSTSIAQSRASRKTFTRSEKLWPGQEVHAILGLQVWMGR